MIPLPDSLVSVAWAQTWQVTLLIAAVALATRLMARNRPHLAHALWLVVLVKLLTPPLLCSCGGVFCWMQATFEQEPVEVVSTEPTEPTEPLPAVAEMALPPPSAAGRILSAQIEVDRTEEVRRTVATVPAVVIETIEPTPGRLASILLGVWLFGAFATLGVSGFRLAVCLRRVRGAALPVDDAYRRMLDRLCRRLGLRRRVRLLITASRIGPAVVGLLRPTVLLPEVVVCGKTPDELEPILAHELLHIRRGDLWVGALQAAARCFWWFHPMVWSADRLISREAERCCDEAVLAELGCSPSRYARSLFDVLERKHILKSLPAFPGVRPVEVTSRRLERIMSLGHGSHKRSPWWCWVVMLLAAAVTLPGAALVVGADEQETPDVGAPGVAPSYAEDEGSSDENVPGPRLLPGRELPPPRVARSDVNSTNAPSQPLPQWNYRVEDLVTSIRQQRGLNAKKARELLLCLLADPALPTPGDVQRPERSVTWIGDHTLVTRDTLAGHRRMSARIEAWRRRGISQITIEVMWITAPAQVIDELELDWPVSLAEVAADDVSDSPTSSHVFYSEQAAKPVVGRTQTVREKSYPVTFALLDEEQADALVDHLETLQGPLPAPIPDLPGDAVQEWQAPTLLDPDALQAPPREPHGVQPQLDGPFRQAIRALFGRHDGPSAADRVRVLAGPEVTLFSGQAATICDGSQRPFVVAVRRVQGDNGEAFQPVIRVVDEGLKLQLVSFLGEGGRVRLECRLTLSDILGVETVVVQRDSRGEPTTSVQVPEVETTSVDTSVLLAVGQTLLISGLRMGDADGAKKSMLMMIRLAEVTPSLDSVGPNLFTRVYGVAHLIKPIPPTAVALSEPGEEERSAAQPDFDSLIERISTTVFPKTWDAMGGLGAIAAEPAKQSLVIRQTNEVHEEIVDLLGQLRYLQETEVQLDVEFMHVPREIVEAIGADVGPENDSVSLSAREARLLRAFVEQSDKADIRELLGTRLTDFRNGHVVRFPVSPTSKKSPKGKTISVGVSRAEGGRLRLDLHCNSAGSRRVTLEAGQTALIDVTKQFPPERWVTDLPTSATPVADGSRLFRQQPPDWENYRTFILLTPRIIPQVEEEQRLSIGGITPRIIIPEDEEENPLGIVVP